MKLLNLDHVAVAVQSLDDSLAVYQRLYGVEPLYREVVDDQGVEEAMIPVGGSFVQLLEPLGSDTPIGRFLGDAARVCTTSPSPSLMSPPP